MNAISSFSSCLRSVCCFHRLCRKKSNFSAFVPSRVESTNSPEGNLSQKVSDVSKSALSEKDASQFLSLADLYDKLKFYYKSQGDVEVSFVDNEVIVINVTGFRPLPIWKARLGDMILAQIAAIVKVKLDASKQPDGPGYPAPAYLENSNLFGFSPSDEGKAP